MSSRSSWSEIFSAAQSSSTSSSRPARPASIRMLGERDQPREPLGPDRRVGPRCRWPSSRLVRGRGRRAVRRWREPRPGRSGRASAICGSPVWRSTSSPTRSRSSATSSGGPTIRALSPSPSTQAISWRALAYGVTNSRSPGRRPPPGGSRRSGRSGARSARRSARLIQISAVPIGVAELPVDPVRVGARIEVRRALEVVLGLGRVADLAADPRQPEDADRAALVRAPDDVELAALVEQLVGVDLARRRPRRAPSCSSRTRSSCGGRSRSRSSPAAARRSWPPAEPVIPSATVRCSGASSGLGRPQEICCSASRSGSA